MKLSFFIALLSLSSLTFADTIREKNIRKEMMDRVDVMIEKIEDARKDLKKEQVVEACARVNEVFELYPDHLTDVGTNMNLFVKKVDQTKDAALEQLIQMHQYSLLCARGENSEYVDPKAMRKELGKIKSSLKRQKKIIKKNDTDLENSFYYRYEF